jgi:F0F1-type ATP synthase membrane subunit b/b'
MSPQGIKQLLAQAELNTQALLKQAERDADALRKEAAIEAREKAHAIAAEADQRMRNGARRCSGSNSSSRTRRAPSPTG